MDRRRPTLIDQILQARGTLEKLLTLLQSRTICFSPLPTAQGIPVSLPSSIKGRKQIERCVISTFQVAESMGFKATFGNGNIDARGRLTGPSLSDKATFMELLRKIMADFSFEEYFDQLRRLPYEQGESLLEEVFSWNFRKFANNDVAIKSQQEFHTRLGLFRVDFVISHVSGRPKIGIECDGKDFHSVERDSRRDAAIVATGELDKIYRIRGRDILGKTHDVLHLLGWREPWLFSERSMTILERASVPDYLRNDDWGELSSGFPYAIIRRYELDRSKVREDHEDADDIGSRRATLICWTE